MKTCPLCNQVIKNDEYIIAVLAAKYIQREGAYDIEVSRQAILSHVNCPPVILA